MEWDGLAASLILTTGLERPKVPQAATDAYAVTRGRTARSSRIGETCKGDLSLTLNILQMQCSPVLERDKHLSENYIS
jgi:hypothetical protein